MLSYKQKNLSRWWYILCYNQRPAVLKNMGAIPCAAMLAATTNGHWAPRYVAKTFMCCSYSHNFPQLFPAKKAKRHLQNNINDFISSHPHPEHIMIFYLASILHSIWHSIWQMFWHFIWHSFWHSIWHKTWHSTGHFIWHLFWHSLWHSVWHSLCHVFGSRPSPLAHCIRSWEEDRSDSARGTRGVKEEGARELHLC